MQYTAEKLKQQLLNKRLKQANPKGLSFYFGTLNLTM